MQRHETDVVSLAFAVIFIAIGTVFLSGRVDAFDFLSLWALPVALVATGLVLGALAVARHRRLVREEGPTGAAEGIPPTNEGS